MTSVYISSKLFESTIDESPLAFNESHLKTSQLIRSFCEQATEVAPLCGMMLGNLAAPFVRFHTSQFLGKFLGKEGFLRSASSLASWFCAVSTEGFLITATPGVIHRDRLGVSLLQGTTHATLTMMVCEGISKRLPFGGGILGSCSQDLGVLLVNWGCGELSISEKTQGSFADQLLEARVVSMRITVSACLVRTSFAHTSHIRAKYELQQKTEESCHSTQTRRSKANFLNPLSEKIAQWIGVVRFITAEGIEYESSWENSTKQAIQESQNSFMGRKDKRHGNQHKKNSKTSSRKSKTQTTQNIHPDNDARKLAQSLLQFLDPLSSRATPQPNQEPQPLQGGGDLLWTQSSSGSKLLIPAHYNSPTSTPQRKNNFIDSELLGLRVGTYLDLPETSRRFILANIYELIRVTNTSVMPQMLYFGQNIPQIFRIRESLDFAPSPYSNESYSTFVVSYPDFLTDFGRDMGGKAIDRSTSLREAIKKFSTSRICVTTIAGMEALTKVFLDLIPAARIERTGARKTVITIPTSTELEYQLNIQANRMMARVDPKEGISIRKLLQMQDTENDLANVLLVKRREENHLIVRGSAARAGLSHETDEILIAHTHPWPVEDLSSLNPGTSEIEFARKQQNTQVGIYRKGMVIFHRETEILPPLRTEDAARRGKITFIPFTDRDDFFISTQEDNVFIRPHPNNVEPNAINIFPIVEVTFKANGELPHFTDGKNKIEHPKLLRHMGDKRF